MEYKVGKGILITVCTIAIAAIMLIQSRRRRAKQLLDEEAYIVCFSPLYTGIMIFGIVFWQIITWVAILLDELDIVVMLVLLAFILFCLLGCFIMLFWGIVVHEDKGILVYYHPPLRPIQIRISDITKVQFLENRLNSRERYRIRIFQHTRKHIDVSDEMENFYLLAKYLAEKEAGLAAEADIYRQYNYGRYTIEQGYFRQGKIEMAEMADDFTVMETLSEKVRSGGLALFFLIVDILLAWNWNEWSRGDPYYNWYFAGAALITLVGMTVFIPQMLRKVSVCNHTICVRNGIGRNCVYDVGEISAVERKQHYLLIYANGKRIAKISKDDTNFASFEEWLNRELERVCQSIQNDEV